MEKNSRKFKVAYYVAVAVILLFAVNIISSLAFTRYGIDLTSDKSFTLSEGSDKILKEINEPVTLRFFFSNKTASGIPVLKSYAARIRGLLEGYVSASGGKIKLEVIDPEPFSDDEDKAVAYGIKGVDIDQMGTKAYLGLVMTNSVDDARIMPFISLDKEKFLEYEITKSIYDLANPKKKVIGVLSSIEMGTAPLMGIPGMGGAKWYVLQQLSQAFEVKDMGKVLTEAPKDVDVLMVVQPRELSNETLYAIDQYILGGGRAIFFIDPNREGAGTGNPNDRLFSHGINRLFNSWGINISGDIVIADRNAARKYDKGADTENQWKYVDNITWLNLHDDAINRDDIITGQLKNININTAGSIEPFGESEVVVTPLLTTSKMSQKLAASDIGISPDVNAMLRNFVPDNKSYILAARLSGKAKTAFPEMRDAGHLVESKEPINVVIVADTDLLRDDVWSKTQDVQGYTVVSAIADNSAFVTNAIDNLSGTEALINLRSKGAAERPFTKVIELKRKAEERYLAKEQELKDRLAATENRLGELKQMAEEAAGSRLEYQAEQQAEIRRFSSQVEETRKELRNVQGELRKDIEKLGSILKFINIWLMPIIIVVFAIFIFVANSARKNKKG